MPGGFPHPCGWPGCGRATTDRYCSKHADRQQPATPWRTSRESAHKRGYGADWRRLRTVIIARDPICKVCTRAPSTTVDHIVSKALGGDDSEANLRGLCATCHKRKTGQDAAAGRREAARARRAKGVGGQNTRGF
ncbi:MAG: HNH endonuclease [Phycisphaerales bacterium]|nr:HNH endonuclease [Phycisphaerales bacterium]